ncbi:MAG: hypothetical protein J5635_04930 [Paludibacteraceae bacterium]|nr:hypothetical protein [Paludibacteraceae bacterium]
MAKIDEHTEQKIKDAARITDVMEASGFQLRRRGASLECLCPFHEDRHLGSFKVNVNMNTYYCFSCGAKGDPIKFLMEYEKMDYPTALRYLAAMYSIYIDDAPKPKVKPRVPRVPLPPTQQMYWGRGVLMPYTAHVTENNLVKWMLSLPFRPEHRTNLEMMLRLYQIGTSIKGATAGWTVFPQIDMQFNVRDIKLMKYKADGHRDKDGYSFNWMHSLMAKAGRFDESKYHVDHCLFGLHLATAFPKAEVCIVESEKSALLCSAFSDPNERIWMATGGKSGLRPQMLEPLMEQKRDIILFPDFDGYQEWQERRDAIGYPQLTMSNKVKQLHIQSDGPKADIADIMVRTMSGVRETDYDKACRRFGIDGNECLKDMMDKLQLTIE